ncbi:hypothetical protein EVAR_85894_1 [Eumeta japonica]|uniref:Uncharacterized protein n=1 Tax=Eumeta variegata TaxID=151549 RepID=A0A4C2A6P7_EUMVA|nr:hypothetical protein EVAR_85894_1 [Eumeta japonica]
MVTTETNSPYHYLKRSTWPTQAGKTELKAMGCGQVKAAPKKLQHLTSRRQQTPAENFTVEDGERPLRVQTDLSEAGSVKAIPTRKTVRRSNSDGAQHKSQRMGASKLPLVTTRNRRRFDSSPPSQPSESKIEERRLSMLPRTKKEGGGDGPGD